MAGMSTNKILGNSESVLTGLLGLGLIGILYLVIYGNLGGNLGFDDDVLGITVSNETGAYINATEYTLSVVNSSTSGYTITAVWNSTPTAFVLSGNYSVSALGNLTNATESDFSTGSYALNISYDYDYTTKSLSEKNSDNVINNLTGGVVTFFGFADTLFTLTAITLLIGIILVVLRLVRGNKETGGFSS